MNAYERTIDFVVKGYVLDDESNWVLLSHKVAQEAEFRKHLEDGEVLDGDVWIPLDQALGR